MCTGFWWQNPKQRGHLGEEDMDGECNMRMDPKEIEWKRLELSVSSYGLIEDFFNIPVNLQFI